VSNVHEWIINHPTGSEDTRALADWILANDAGPVLDAGCGNGVLIRQLWPVVALGMDIEPGHVRLANEFNNMVVATVWDFLSPMMATVFQDFPFSLVTCINWTHNNWRRCHAVDPSVAPHPDTVPLADQEVLPAAAFAAHKYLNARGRLIIDWPDQQFPVDLIESDRCGGWTLEKVLQFSKPFFIFRRKV
jgi:SAM-dependent methyltransferase